ncbi:hypothetical protein [Blastomonas natatoria]|nr:hypothetical protein [Blastomonas natatoria]
MWRLAFPLFSFMAAPVSAPPSEPLPTGTFTNEEQVYFDAEVGGTPPPWIGVRIEVAETGLVWKTIDRLGTVLASTPVQAGQTEWMIGTCALTTRTDADGAMEFVPGSGECTGVTLPVRLDRTALTLRLADGRETRLLRARPFTCWMSVRRDRPKSDGSDDWLFQPGMATHDQGGRLRLGGGDSGAPEAIIRIRNVVWPPPSRNRSSIVLYVFTPDDMNRAVAYGWADPGAVRVGINQRWMQASCTLDGAE